MRDKAFTMRLCGTAAGAIIFMLAVGCPAEAADTAAHDIAEKFAREAANDDASARRRAESERRKADEHVRKAKKDWLKVEEAEMLARARAEAEQRRVDMMRAREEAERADRQRKTDAQVEQAQAARNAEEDRRLAQARRKADEEVEAAEAASQAEAVRKAEEERRLAEIRKAEEETRAAEALRQAESLQRAQEERRIAEAEARRTAEEEARVAEELRQAEAARRAEEVRLQAEAQRTAEEGRLAEAQRAKEVVEATQARRIAEQQEQHARLEAEREAEAQRLAERLRSVREARDARTAGAGPVANAEAAAEQSSPAVTGSPKHQLTWQGPPRDEPEESARHVTVLLLMQPGDRGIRRNNKSADPVLCGYRECYVSNGPGNAASLLPARKALGFFRTWGRRAGACNNALGCVFRGVDLESLGGVLRPVDMRVVRHDRREPQEIEFASHCQFERERLMCRNGIYAQDYAMWVVPERMAAAAGPSALVQALEDGLPASERTASAPPWSAR